MQGLVQKAGGSQGSLCLGSAIGRSLARAFNGGSSGEGVESTDLGALPTPNGTVAVMAGDTQHFQCWDHDESPGSTSNFSDAISIVFFAFD